MAIVGQELAKQNIQKFIPFENNLLAYNRLFSQSSNFHKCRIFALTKIFTIYRFTTLPTFHEDLRVFCSPRHTTSTHDLCYRVQDIQLIHGHHVYSTLEFSHSVPGCTCYKPASLLPVNSVALSFNTAIIKTHGSESRGQEEAAVRDERVSYLHVALL